MKVAILAAVILWQQSGCDQPPVQQPVKVPEPDKRHYQRFIPIPREANVVGVPWSGGVALDTMTGQLCRTYDMAIKGWDTIPLCYYLYETEH
jgi:hypothetical protein